MKLHTVHLVCLVSSLVPLVTKLAAGDERPATRPNIVVILADDLGYGDVGCYNKNSQIPTPHIDRLAAQGMRFTDAHSPSSVCSPTRYGLLTGRYAWRTELKSLVLWAFDRPLIEPHCLTLPRMLREYGYHTACIGKWHLGWTWKTVQGQPLDLPFKIGERGPHAERVRLASDIDYTRRLGGGPLAAGFDYYSGDDVINQPPYLWIENNRCLTLPMLPEHPAILRGSSNGPATKDWDQAKVLPKLTEQAVGYIQQRAGKNREQPFFLYFPLTAPHVPIVPPAEFAGKSKFGAYGDFVFYVDWIVGQVTTTLKQARLQDNTIVIFTSDNGSYVSARDGHHPNGYFRGRKGMIFEGGHRVPLIVRWPGHVAATSVNNQLVGLNDIQATISAIIGHRVSDTAAEDSISLLPTMRDKNVSVRDHLIHHSVSGEFAIRNGKWKLIPQSDFLFDMEDDPQEKINLWSERTEIVDRLSKRLKAIQSGE